MKKLITRKSPQKLIDALNNNIFHAVVKRHEIAESSYTTMLEDAVDLLVQDIITKNAMLIKYAERFGDMNEEHLEPLVDWVAEEMIKRSLVPFNRKNRGIFRAQQLAEAGLDPDEENRPMNYRGNERQG